MYIYIYIYCRRENLVVYVSIKIVFESCKIVRVTAKTPDTVYITRTRLFSGPHFDVGISQIMHTTR